MDYVTAATVYLVKLVFGLYLLAVMLRFLLQWIGADFYNPVCQFLVAITNPALRPLRRWVPNYRGIDGAAAVVLILLQLIASCLTMVLTVGRLPSPMGLPFIVIAELFELLIWIYIIVILARAVISLIKPGVYSPVVVLLYQISEPLQRPIRYRLPVYGGIDWSPLVALVALQLALILIVAPLRDLGRYLAF